MLHTSVYTLSISYVASMYRLLHARRYAAAVVYADGSCSVAHQLKAAEYGSTTDPVTLLLPGMLSRQRDGNRPTHIIQVRKNATMY
jgi:hypothetical protein